MHCRIIKAHLINFKVHGMQIVIYDDHYELDCIFHQFMTDTVTVLLHCSPHAELIDIVLGWLGVLFLFIVFDFIYITHSSPATPLTTAISAYPPTSYKFSPIHMQGTSQVGLVTLIILATIRPFHCSKVQYSY